MFLADDFILSLTCGMYNVSRQVNQNYFHKMVWRLHGYGDTCTVVVFFPETQHLIIVLDFEKPFCFIELENVCEDVEEKPFLPVAPVLTASPLKREQSVV